MAATATSASARPPLQPASSSFLSPTKTDEKSKTSSARNPIALRLYKILGTSYDDQATREAFATLSELYGGPDPTRASAKGKAVDREASSITEGDEEAVRTTVAPADLSVGGGIAARARKNLRRDAELELSRGSQQFLRAFREVDKVWYIPSKPCRIDSERVQEIRCSPRTH